MNLGEIYDYINFILNRDQLGDPQSPEQFSLLLKYHNRQYYKDLYDELVKLAIEQGRKLVDVSLEAKSPISRFIEEKKYDLPTASNPSKNLSLPSDFKRNLSISAYSDNSWREVETVSELEYTRKTQNIFEANPQEFPFGRLKYAPEASTSGEISVLPATIEIIPWGLRKYRVVYFRDVCTPFFDYCIDESDNVVYMPENSKLITRQGGTEFRATLIDEDGNELKDHVTVRDESLDYPYTSQSVELDWNDGDENYFINVIIQDASTRARENVTSNNQA